jgi:flavorubredoxin
MNRDVAIAEGTYWVGANDYETDLFEGLWPLPRGVSYNAYVILDRACALIDTVKKTAADALLENLRVRLGPVRAPEFLIVNHLEPDHSGSIAILREAFPDMAIVGNARTAEFLDHLYGITDNVRVVRDGEAMDLGAHTLRFFLTPMVHWPETMMTYDATTRTLFSGDAFGGFGALEGGLFDDEVDIEYYDDEILRYFSNIVGKFSPMVRKAIDRLQGVEIRIIASTHGPVWRKYPQRIVNDYNRWSRYEGETGVVVAHASMYGNTRTMMEAVARGLADEYLCPVRVHDVCRVHPSFILRDIWRYKGLLLGTPTYDVRAFPTMEYLLQLLAQKKLKNRVLGVFGTYGWTGGGMKALRQFAEDEKYELVEPLVEARFSPKPDDLALCETLGRNMARRLQQR